MRKLELNAYLRFWVHVFIQLVRKFPMSIQFLYTSQEFYNLVVFSILLDTSIHNLAIMDSWLAPCNSKPFAKKKKKNLFIASKTQPPHFSTLGFHVGLDRMMKLILILRHKPK